MDKVNASYFKTHFGNVLDRASIRAIRIERRGRGAAVILSEEAFEALKQRASLVGDVENEALARLSNLAKGKQPTMEALSDNLRGTAILEKHTKHWKNDPGTF